MQRAKVCTTTRTILEKAMQRVAPLPSQAGYVQALATIISMHFQRNLLIDEGYQADELPVSSAIVVAPTGQGKSYLVRKMADVLNLNIITIDCGTLCAEGWKGISLSQHLGSAMEAAQDKRSFEQSILFLDEIDKLKLWGSMSDQGNAMTSILQLFNGGTVAVEIHKRIEKVDISRFTILLGGAFEGLHEIISDRVSNTRIGFNCDFRRQATKAELMQQVIAEDLAEFGILPELLGRIGTILVIPPLGTEDYRQLLIAENGSVQKKYNNYFKGLFGVDFEISDAGADALAHKCMLTSAGARAINPLVNDLMRDAIVAVEEDDSISRVILDADGDGCRIRYEHDLRKYSDYDPTRRKVEVSLEQHVIKAKSIPALKKKLLRYYRNSEKNTVAFQELDAFLDCSLTFLAVECPEEDFVFTSLEKLARVTCREDRLAPFDDIIRDARCITEKQIEQYDANYNNRTSQHLMNALRSIMIYIQNQHGKRSIAFLVKNKKV